MSLVLLFLVSSASRLIQLSHSQMPGPVMPAITMYHHYPSASIPTPPVQFAAMGSAMPGYHGEQYGAHEPASSNCALVLQRTFVNGKRKSQAPSFGGFFDLFKGHDRGSSYNDYDSDKSGHQEVCIRHVDVNRAIQQAKHRRRYSRPEGLDSLEPPLPALDTTGELVLEVTRLVSERFKMSPDEILNGLPLMDTSKTFLWDECPTNMKPIPCTVERYRTYTGHCNNLKNPSWGAAYTPFVRYLPPVFADGISAPRVSVVDGGDLPSPRKVTSLIHRDMDRPSPDLTVLIMSWGQFIDHDLTLAAPPRDDNEHDFECCIESDNKHPNCFPIAIPADDPFYAQHSRTCMEFKRSIAGQRPNCALGPRVNVNTLTSSIDANFIYGSDEKINKKLRAFRGGLMRTWDRFRDYGLKPLLPPESENPEKDCTARPRHLFCFVAGDERVNEQIHLTVLHTLYLREHNRIASGLSDLNPHWDDERIFQEARHITAAVTQHITINEFLPLLLGEDLVGRYNLTEATGYWDGYDPEVHMGPSHGFSVAAFRFGHTFIQGSVRRYNKFHEFLGEDLLRNLLRQPFMIYEPGKLDELVGGFINTPSQSYDPFISEEVSGHLFQNPDAMFGLDLPAINLQRGREQGIPGYNVWREWCGLPRVETFEELSHFLQNRTAFHYSKLFKHPDDIDLWSGGISEYKLPGGQLGPTFSCIIARQFANLRRGDRFWFENSGYPSAFTPEQLAEIKKTSQAKIICENSDDVPTIQHWVMRMPHPVYNPRHRCDDLPSLDLRYWQEEASGYKSKK